jgi:hypothetical protein
MDDVTHVLDQLGPQLVAVLEDAAATLAATMERLDNAARAASLLPPGVPEAPRVRRERRALIDAMWKDLFVADAAADVIGQVEKVLAERCDALGAPASVWKAAEDWREARLLHDSLIETEDSTLRVLALLPELGPEDADLLTRVAHVVRTRLVSVRVAVRELEAMSESERNPRAAGLMDELDACVVARDLIMVVNHRFDISVFEHASPKEITEIAQRPWWNDPLGTRIVWWLKKLLRPRRGAAHSVLLHAYDVWGHEAFMLYRKLVLLAKSLPHSKRPIRFRSSHPYDKRYGP